MRRFPLHKNIAGKRNGNRHILQQFTVSYLFLTLIPIIMALVSYRYALSFSGTQLQNSNLMVMTNSMNILESSMNTIHDLYTSLYGLSFVDSFSAASREELNLMDLRKTVSELPKIRDSNNYIQDYYIYSSQNKIALAPNKVFLDMRLYYDVFFKHQNAGFERWSRELFAPIYNPRIISTDWLFGESASGRIYYQAPYFNRRAGKITGQFLFELNREELQRTLEPAFSLGIGFVYIAGADGRVLFGLERDYPLRVIDGLRAEPAASGALERTVDGETMIVYYCKSKVYDLICVTAIPKSVLVRDVRSGLRFNVLGTAAILTVGLVLIYVSYAYNKRPLAQMADAIKTHGPLKCGARPKTNNGLWLLSSSMTEVLKSNSDMELQLNEQRNRLRESFLLQLLTGAVVDERKLADNLREHGLQHIENCSYRGVYLCAVSEENSGGSALRELLDGLPPELVPCFLADARHALALYAAPPGGTGFELFFKELNYAIKHTYGVDISFYIGFECPSLRDVHQSFAEARTIFNMQAQVSRQVLFVNDFDVRSQPVYEYSSSQETKLLELAGIGEYEALCRELDLICSCNFEQKKLSPYMWELLFHRMVGTLYYSKYSGELSLQQPKPEQYTAEEFFTMLKAQYFILCQYAQNKRREEKEAIGKELLGHINAHYQDSSLSLSALSLRFGMAETYMSTLFKQLFGENFSVYVERLRINRANELLRDRRFSITEIGSLVGYENITTFGRAYKRVMGCSPSQYQKSHVHKPEV